MMAIGRGKCLGLGALISAVLLAGCGDDKMVDTAAEPTTQAETTGTTTETATTIETPTTTTGEPMTSTTEPTTTEPTTGTTEDTTTTEPGAMCNPTTQDCAAGQKCIAYDSMGMMYWDANQCVDEPKNPGAVGDPCNIDGGESVFSGLDNCGAGTICLNFDFETGQGGTCTAFCGEGNSCGADEVCVESANEGVLPICLGACDPLLQDCPDMQGCFGDPSLDGFICFSPDIGDNTGSDGSPCEFTNACLAGFSCQAAETVEGCDEGSSGCCTPFCSVMEGDASCAASEDCVPFYAMDAPPELEDVGVCVIPS